MQPTYWTVGLTTPFRSSRLGCSVQHWRQNLISPVSALLGWKYWSAHERDSRGMSARVPGGVHRTCVHATTEVCARSMADVVRWSHNPCSCCRTCSGSVRPILWTRLEQMTAVQLFPNPCTPHPSNLPAPNEPFTSTQVQSLLVLPFLFHHLLPDKEKLAERHVVFLTAIYIGTSRRSSCVSGVAGALAGASGTHYDEVRSLVVVALLRHVFMKLLLGGLVQRHGASILAAFKRILQQQLVHGSLTLRLPEQRSQGDTT